MFIAQKWPKNSVNIRILNDVYKNQDLEPKIISMFILYGILLINSFLYPKTTKNLKSIIFLKEIEKF